ncbi:putative phosphomethylethanolamine N-methyltransferase-like [Penaeus vannamei]|uniref:phosphoethanolamine N-methyltransferase n=1 Tax=Penaeus vannamei TaxID=6689 RepID=A0A423TXG4_PENVA|nr:putative phosphomethylethanolamine N-methyltransferase-like [Penaeus vannamei]
MSSAKRMMLSTQALSPAEPLRLLAEYSLTLLPFRCDTEVPRLAQEADHVTFVFPSKGGNSVEMNKSSDKVTYKCDDVTELSFPPSSFEMVVGAWVLSGLSDLQANDFLHRVLDWLVPEGHFVFREACGFHEGWRGYSATLGFQQEANLQLGTAPDSRLTDSRRGTAQIGRADIGGQEFCQRLGLQPGHKVLDVGCGTGGSPFFMSRLSSTMIDLAVELQTHLQRVHRKRVHFEVRDILNADFDGCIYDVIYSQNSIYHIAKKEELFAKLYVTVTDYCVKSTQPSEACADFAAKECSTLLTISAYERGLSKAGFSVESRDLADDFCSIHQKELDAFLSTREGFLEECSQLEFEETVAMGTNKITLVKTGQLTWASFFARK